MYGGGNNFHEQHTDNWINQNIPGGVNSPIGQMLDNAMGGNPNPTYGQMYGTGASNRLYINPVSGQYVPGGVPPPPPGAAAAPPKPRGGPGYY